MDKLVRVFVIEDEETLGIGLKGPLEEDGTIEVVGFATTLADAIPAIASSKPEVIVADFFLVGETTRNLPRSLGADGPKVLYYSGQHSGSVILDADKSGGAGFLGKRSSPQALRAKIRAIAGGESGFSLRDRDAARRAPKPPSDAERPVLEGIAAGRSAKEVGDQLRLSPRTIEGHLSRMRTRYGSTTTAQLVALAVRERWVEDGPTGPQRGS